jgi:hypothetical protein
MQCIVMKQVRKPIDGNYSCAAESASPLPWVRRQCQHLIDRREPGGNFFGSRMSQGTHPCLDRQLA